MNKTKVLIAVLRSRVYFTNVLLALECNSSITILSPLVLLNERGGNCTKFYLNYKISILYKGC